MSTALWTRTKDRSRSTFIWDTTGRGYLLSPGSIISLLSCCQIQRMFCFEKLSQWASFLRSLAILTGLAEEPWEILVLLPPCGQAPHLPCGGGAKNVDCSHGNISLDSQLVTRGAMAKDLEPDCKLSVSIFVCWLGLGDVWLSGKACFSEVGLKVGTLLMVEGQLLDQNGLLGPRGTVAFRKLEEADHFCPQPGAKDTWLHSVKSPAQETGWNSPPQLTHWRKPLRA